MTLWGVRWTVGFALIWGAVTYEPAWDWLWWVGAGGAALSLVAILATHTVLSRKFDRVRAATEEAQTAAESVEDET